MSYIRELDQRKLLAKVTSPDLRGLMEKESLAVYCGFDPTAQSLHIGNLVPLICLRRAQLAGHRPIAVVGGATGMIGDPSGRSSERKLLDPATLERNILGIRQDLERVLDFSAGGAILVNNADWLGKLGFLEVLRDLGKDFSLGMMLAKESVRSRMKSESGLSYTEFSYMLLQSCDFLHLFKEHGCRVQIGGNDQWGNITAGIDLIRRKTGGQAFGVTFPLILDSSGNKFGKSTGGCLYLSEKFTSHFDFYQYFLRCSDADVLRYLAFFTPLKAKDIEDLGECVRREPEKREAQRVLAAEITEAIRGASGLVIAERATGVFFGNQSVQDFDDATLRTVFGDVPHGSVPRASLEAGFPLIDALITTGLCRSKGEARRLILGGGVSLNNRRCPGGQEGLSCLLGISDLASPSMLVVRAGKKRYALLEVGGGS